MGSLFEGGFQNAFVLNDPQTPICNVLPIDFHAPFILGIIPFLH
ncbi:MAG: hypothetical protein ABI045_00645 [Flavobacteriales bacterium]